MPSILAAPTLSDADKSQIVAELEKHTGGADKVGTVKNFLSALAENNRLGLLEGVCEKFGTLMSAARGEIEFIVTSAAVCQQDAFGVQQWSKSFPLEDVGVRNSITDNDCPQKLDDKLLRRLETAISKSEYSQGKKLKVTTKVNPDILGGLVVEIGERTIDLSVSSKIAKLNKMLTDTV